MNKRDLTEFLNDILDAIAEVEGFTAGVTLEALSTNREKLLAVVKLLEIISEATKKIPLDLRQRHPQIPCVAGMRDVLVHEYWRIDEAVVFETVIDALPSLKRAIREMLDVPRE